MKRIAFVFAHPDDETFATGGTICRYAEDPETEIHLVCATRGEAGKTGSPPQCSPEELGKVREAELHTAAGILGIDAVTFLDFRDGTLADLPEGHLAAAVKKELLRIAPRIVVTFAEHGISGHKDHQAIHRATRECILSGDIPSVEALYYVTVPRSMSRNGIPAYTDPDERIDVRIATEAYRDKVMQALMAHKTQNMSVNRVFPGVLEGNPASVRKAEHYLLGWIRTPCKVRPDDLFPAV